jgi:hypothetical protein
MHDAEISKSQIQFHPNADVFLHSPGAERAAADGLAALAALVGDELSAGSTLVFLGAFAVERAGASSSAAGRLDCGFKLAQSVVTHFGSGLKSGASVKKFLRSLRRYELYLKRLHVASR